MEKDREREKEGDIEKEREKERKRDRDREREKSKHNKAISFNFLTRKGDYNFYLFFTFPSGDARPKRQSQSQRRRWLRRRAVDACGES